MAALSLCCCAWASSSYRVQGLIVASLVAEHKAIGHVGFSSSWSSRALEWLWSRGLVALQHVESSWTRDGTHVPLLCRQILNHWILQGSPLFCSIDMLVFMPLPQGLVYHNLKSGSVSPPTEFFFFKIVLAVLGPLHFQVSFRTNVSVSTKKKKACWDFAWDYIEFLGEEGGELTS